MERMKFVGYNEELASKSEVISFAPNGTIHIKLGEFHVFADSAIIYKEVVKEYTYMKPESVIDWTYDDEAGDKVLISPAISSALVGILLEKGEITQDDANSVLHTNNMCRRYYYSESNPIMTKLGFTLTEVDRC